MSQARTTPLTSHPKEHTRLLHILCPTYPSPQSYTSSLQTLTQNSLLQALVSTSQQTSYPSPSMCSPTTNVPQSMRSLIAGEKIFSLAPPTARKGHRAWNTQLPVSPPKKHQRPAPYHKNLSPLPSPLCPHCPTGQRLRLWCPLIPRSSSSPQVSDDDLKCIEAVIAQPDTHMTYTSSLLNYMVFCDKKSIPEVDRAPFSQLLLMSFILTLAAAYSGSAISNYICGIRAWHLLHFILWRIEKPELDTMLKAAEKLTPPSSKRKK